MSRFWESEDGAEMPWTRGLGRRLEDDDFSEASRVTRVDLLWNERRPLRYSNDPSSWTQVWDAVACAARDPQP